MSHFFLEEEEGEGGEGGGEEHNKNLMQNIKNHLNYVELKKYCEYLEKEIKKLNDGNLTLKIHDWDEGNENEIVRMRKSNFSNREKRE